MKKLKVWLLLFVMLGCAPQKKYDLVYAVFSDPDWNKFYQEVLEKFEKEKGIAVKLLTIPGEQYIAKLETMSAGGTPPDVFFLNEKFILRFAEKGVIQSLNPFIKKDPSFDIEDFFPQILNAVKYEGHLYQMPFFFSTVALFYNKNLFDDAGVEYPNENWTWKTFLEAAKKLTKDIDQDGKPDIYGYAIVPWLNRWAIWVWQNGGEVFSPDGKRCLLNTPEAIEAIQFYADLANVYRVSPPISYTKEHDVNSLFVMGRIAMTSMSRFQIAVFRKIKGFEWDAAPLPRGRRRATTFIVGGNVMSSDSKDPQKAWELIKYLSSKEVLKKALIEFGNLCPPRKSLAFSEYYLTPSIPPANDEVFLTQAKYGKLPAISADASAVDQVFKELEVVWMGKKKAIEVIPHVVKRVNEILAKEE